MRVAVALGDLSGGARPPPRSAREGVTDESGDHHDHDPDDGSRSVPPSPAGSATRSGPMRQSVRTAAADGTVGGRGRGAPCAWRAARGTSRTALRRAPHPVGDRPRPPPILGSVSTRTLIILALVCGLAVLVAFAVQAAQIM